MILCFISVSVVGSYLQCTHSTVENALVFCKVLFLTSSYADDWFYGMVVCFAQM